MPDIEAVEPDKAAEETPAKQPLWGCHSCHQAAGKDWGALPKCTNSSCSSHGRVMSWLGEFGQGDHLPLDYHRR